MKVNFSEGSYLKASDVAAPQLVTITAVTQETLDNATKIAVHFRELSKPLVLNKTNGRLLTDLYGDETAAWVGRTVVIYATSTPYQGRTVPCLRLSAPQQQQPVAPQYPPQAVPQPYPPQQPVVNAWQDPRYSAPVQPQQQQGGPADGIPFDA